MSLRRSKPRKSVKETDYRQNYIGHSAGYRKQFNLAAVRPRAGALQIRRNINAMCIFNSRSQIHGRAAAARHGISTSGKPLFYRWTIIEPRTRRLA